MTDFCPTLSADPAIMYVGDAHHTFINLATRTYDLAVQQASQLATFAALPTSFNVNFDFDDQLTPFVRPLAPTLNPADFLLQVPATPALPPQFDAQPPDFVATPADDIPTPVLSYGPRPVTPNIVAPTPPPRPRALIIPDAPDYVMPELPTFEQLNLPNAPDLVLPLFDAPRPEFIEPPINENWSFDPAAYVSTLLPKLQAKVTAWMDGQQALPDAIERALFDRGRSRIVVEVSSEIEQAYDDFAARGFSQPPGMLAARIDGIRQGGQNRIAEFNRDVTIKQYDETLANMRLAVQQGIALEGVAVNLHLEEQRMLLQSAQFSRETAIAILNARISIHNARLEGYKTDAQVLRDRIQAELAKVEVFRAQIEGERARGEINEQRAKLYGEQIRALGVLADFYRTRVQAVETQATVDRAVIEGYKAEVDAFGTRWDAHGKEWDGYKSSVDAENTKATVHRNLVDAYGTRVQAVTSQNSAVLDRERLRIAQHGQHLEVYARQLDGFHALLGAETARLGAAGQKADAEARIYIARGGVEQAASAAADRTFQLGLSREQAEVDTQLKAAEIRVQENIQLTGLMADVRKMLTQVLGQLTASSMSAVNYSAGVTSSRQQSKSCSTDFNFAGEIIDAGI